MSDAQPVPTSGTRRLVFISHSGIDTWVAKQIARAVAERGAEPFLDEADIQVGADFDAEIRAFLERAHELVVLWTPWSLERPFVLMEVGAAWLRQIPIVQVLYGVRAGELQTRAGFPSPLKGRDMIDINDIEAYLQELDARSRLHAATIEGETDG